MKAVTDGPAGQPAEVAWAICYLASPLSGSTTGTVLGVDGGMVGLRI
jgi:2-keto-3-deoxy-L-fuconate dehydrogenase